MQWQMVSKPRSPLTPNCVLVGVARGWAWPAVLPRARDSDLRPLACPTQEAFSNKISRDSFQNRKAAISAPNLFFAAPFCFIFLLHFYAWLHQHKSCGIWDLVPWPGIEHGLPALGIWSLSHWTTREVPLSVLEIWKAHERKGHVILSKIFQPYKRSSVTNSY